MPELGFRVAPDGGHVLLTVRHELSTWHPVEGEYLLPLKGQRADLIRLTEPLTVLDAPRWATDSRHLTFSRPLGPGGYPEIFLYDIETRTERTSGVSGFWPHLFRPEGQ